MTSALYQVVSGLVAIIVLLVWVRPETFKFLLDKGSAYPSLGRQGQYTAMVVSTWVLVTVTIKVGTGPAEWLFIGYMLAWAGAQFGSLWLILKAQQPTPPPGTTVTTVDTSSKREVSTESKVENKGVIQKL